MGLGHVVAGQSGELLIRPFIFLALLAPAYLITAGQRQLHLPRWACMC
jgi:hypothetical protein